MVVSRPLLFACGNFENDHVLYRVWAPGASITAAPQSVVDRIRCLRDSSARLFCHSASTDHCLTKIMYTNSATDAVDRCCGRPCPLNSSQIHLFYVQLPGDRIRRNGWPRLGVNRFLTWSSFRSTTAAQSSQTASVTVANTAADNPIEESQHHPTDAVPPLVAQDNPGQPPAQPMPYHLQDNPGQPPLPSGQTWPATSTILRTNLASHQHHPQDNRSQPPASPAVPLSLRPATSTTDAV